MSGAGPALMGQLAEQWTAGELRRLRRRGWRLINQVHFRTWDIDHVLLGPGGAVVVETKFSAEGWASSRYTDRVVVDARDRARRNAEDLRLNLGKTVLTSSLVTPIVVLWGRGDVETVDREENGVRILSGHVFRGWLARLPDIGLDDGTVSILYDKLAGQVVTRDEQDLERTGPPLKTVSSSIVLLCVATVVGLLACWAELETLHLIGWQWILPIGAAFAAAQWPFRQFGTWRLLRIAWLTGSLAVTAFISLAYIAFAIRHLV